MYPRLGSGGRNPPPIGTRCANCSDDASAPLWIEHSELRTEDSRLWVCTPCISRASRNLRGFLRSCGQRAKYLAGGT
jgi:hypothetical protein